MQKLQVWLILSFAALTSFAEVLYEQTVPSVDWYFCSTKFIGPLLPTGTTNATVQVADDFTVPAGTEWNVNEVTLRGYYNPTYQAGTFVNWTVQFWTDGTCYPGNACPNQILYEIDRPNEVGVDVSNFVHFTFNPSLNFKPGTYWISAFAWSRGNNSNNIAHRWSVELVRILPQPGNAFVVRDQKVIFVEPGIGYRNSWAAYSNPVFDPTSFGNGTAVLFVLEGNAFSVTSGELTSSQVTSASATTQAATSASVTSGAITSGMITSGWGNPLSTSSSVSEDTSASSRNNSKGLIIGFSFGLILLGAVLVVVVIYVFKKVRKAPIATLELSAIPQAQTQILEQIGEGQFGKVYKGLTYKGVLVALKAASAENKKEIEKESSILSMLDHPNIVRFFGIYSKDGVDYIMLEYINGGDLVDLLSKNNLSMKALMNIAMNVAAGMDYLASKSIVHGDLAARNVLVSVENNVITAKVSDFGMSKVVNGSYYSNSKRQIPIRWCAPEVIKHNKMSIKSDIWSFGVVLWEIFNSGCTPFPGLSNEEVAQQVINGKTLEPPEKCPTEVGQIMKSCFKADPNGRTPMNHILVILSRLANSYTINV